jgi:hypothetical protein
MAYAKGTTVAEEHSRAEIERTIKKHIGRDATFNYGHSPGRAAIQFSARGRQIKFELPLPTVKDALVKARDGRAPNKPPTAEQIEAWLDDESRRRWRCMLLIIKAKFEAIDMKLELCETEEERSQVFDQEFLACIVVGNAGQTLYQAIQEAKVNGQRLLPAVKENVIDINSNTNEKP